MIMETTYYNMRNPTKVLGSKLMALNLYIRKE